MAKVKIGKKDYELESLSSLDLKKLEKEKEDNKISDFDYTYLVILHAIKKYNKDVVLSLDQFEDEFPIKGLMEKFKEIGKIIGLDFAEGIVKQATGKEQ